MVEVGLDGGRRPAGDGERLAGEALPVAHRRHQGGQARLAAGGAGAGVAPGEQAAALEGELAQVLLPPARAATPVAQAAWSTLL